jgi:arylsulfatase A-like enzyme
VNGVDLEPQEGYLTDLLTDGVMDFIDRNQSRNFFIYLAYNSPHTPLQAPEEYLTRYAHIQDETRGKYAAMVANLDHNVGRIIDQLETLGLRDHTLVVVISDNGGGIRLGANNGALKGGKAQLWEGGVRVPFIISWPGYLDESVVIDTPLSSLDLLPTFAFVAGVTPEGKPLDGKNIIPWLKGEAEGRPHERLYWENKQVKGMRDGDYKMVRISEDHPWFLSNLSDDIGESKNLGSSQAEVLKRMESTYWEWYNNLPPVGWPDPDR